MASDKEGNGIGGRNTTTHVQEGQWGKKKSGTLGSWTGNGQTERREQALVRVRVRVRERAHSHDPNLKGDANEQRHTHDDASETAHAPYSMRAMAITPDCARQDRLTHTCRKAACECVLARARA
eukprot:3480197-Pleurochrysis_carterae.AAC.1